MTSSRRARARSGNPTGWQRSQSGVALVSILFVVALISAIAYQLMQQQSLTIAQSRIAFNGSQARHFALGAEAFARQALHEDWNNGATKSKDTLAEVWAQPLAPFEIEGGFLEVQFTDLHRCFNVNALARADGGRDDDEDDEGEGRRGNNPASANPLVRFKTLLRYLAIDEVIADSVKDWVDADDEVTGFGAEDSEYLIAQPSYRAANTLLTDISELRAVQGVTDEVFTQLAPHVCALPDSELALNINTVSTPVLLSLSSSLTQANVEPFVNAERDFSDVATATAEFAELAAATDALTVVSEYFALDVRAEFEGARVELRSILARDPGDGRISLISRDFGRRFTTRFQAEIEEA